MVKTLLKNPESDRRSLRCAGGSTPVPPVASGPRQVALIHRPAHRPWRAIGRRSGARRRPCPDLSTRASGTGVTPPTPTDLPRANKPAPAAPRAHAHPPRAAAVTPLAPPVRTSLQSTPSPPGAPKLFLVHPNSSPRCLLIKPSRTIDGARFPAAAAGPPPPSSPLCRSSALGDLPSVFPRPHGSSRGSVLLSIAFSRTTVRVPAAALLLLRRRRSPATSPTDPPPPIVHG
jgi:hypothetical protein